MNIPEVKTPYFIDPNSLGVVRGGHFDEAGGLLAGMYAEWVCAALNEKALQPPKESGDEGTKSS